MSIWIHSSSFILSLTAIIFALTIVWQVERGMDKAFKFLTIALVFFAFDQTLELLSSLEIIPIDYSLPYIRGIGFIFLVFFLAFFNNSLKAIWNSKSKKRK